MERKIAVGDIVKSTCGRDKDGVFLVVSVEGERVFIADGKIRKISSLKKKNLKHLEILIPQADEEFADRIVRNVPTSNERLKKRIAERFQKK